MIRRRIRPDRAGGCQLHLPAAERQLLESLPSQLVGVLKALDLDTDEVPANLRRLFPRAYVADEEAEAAFRASTRSELAEAHREALEIVAATARQRVLDPDQMASWMAALNDLRLVLGTALGVTEDVQQMPASAADNEAMIYHYLTLLQSELIDVMESSLPPAVPGADEGVPDDPWGEPLGGLRWDGTPAPRSPFEDEDS